MGLAALMQRVASSLRLAEMVKARLQRRGSHSPGTATVAAINWTAHAKHAGLVEPQGLEGGGAAYVAGAGPVPLGVERWLEAAWSLRLRLPVGGCFGIQLE
jgi:hypothetical protein